MEKGVALGYTTSGGRRMCHYVNLLLQTSQSPGKVQRSVVAQVAVCTQRHMYCMHKCYDKYVTILVHVHVHVGDETTWHSVQHKLCCH